MRDVAREDKMGSRTVESGIRGETNLGDALVSKLDV